MRFVNVLYAVSVLGIVAALAVVAKPLQAEPENPPCTVSIFGCCFCSINEGGNVYSCAVWPTTANRSCVPGNPGYCNPQLCYPL